MKTPDEIAVECAAAVNSRVARWLETGGTDCTADLILAAIREAAAPLVDALQDFLGYYDEAGIGDCLAGHDDDDHDDEGFDGDERFNVRHARQALAAFDGPTL